MSTELLGGILVASRMPRIISPGLLMAVEAQRNAVVFGVRSAVSLRDDVGRLDFCAATFETEATQAIAAHEHPTFHLRRERHLRIVGHPNLLSHIRLWRLDGAGPRDAFDRIERNPAYSPAM